MAQFTLGEMKSYLKKMYDWINGSSDTPNIKNVNGEGNEIFTNDNPAAVKLMGSYIRQDLSTIFGTIPAGTAKAVVVDVPKEATMFVLGLRITGRVNRVRKSGSIGGFIFHESIYVELTSNDVEQVLSNISNVTNLLTKKIPVYSEKLAIELRASADGDVSANTGSNSGIIIYWWRD